MLEDDAHWTVVRMVTQAESEAFFRSQIARMAETDAKGHKVYAPIKVEPFEGDESLEFKIVGGRVALRLHDGAGRHLDLDLARPFARALGQVLLDSADELDRRARRRRS